MFDGPSKNGGKCRAMLIVIEKPNRDSAYFDGPSKNDGKCRALLIVIKKPNRNCMVEKGNPPPE